MNAQQLEQHVVCAPSHYWRVWWTDAEGVRQSSDPLDKWTDAEIYRREIAARPGVTASQLVSY